MNGIIRVLALGCIAGAMNISLAQDEVLFPDEGGGISLLENMRFTVDLSSRASVNTATGDMSAAQFIGFDMHKVFTGKNGDWGRRRARLRHAHRQPEEASPVLRRRGRLGDGLSHRQL